MRASATASLASPTVRSNTAQAAARGPVTTRPQGGGTCSEREGLQTASRHAHVLRTCRPQDAGGVGDGVGAEAEAGDAASLNAPEELQEEAEQGPHGPAAHATAVSACASPQRSGEAEGVGAEEGVGEAEAVGGRVKKREWVWLWRRQERVRSDSAQRRSQSPGLATRLLDSYRRRGLPNKTQLTRMPVGGCASSGCHSLWRLWVSLTDAVMPQIHTCTAH